MRTESRKIRRQQRNRKITAVLATGSLLASALVVGVGIQSALAAPWTPKAGASQSAPYIAGEDVTVDLSMAAAEDASAGQYNVSATVLIPADVAVVGQSAALGTPRIYGPLQQLKNVGGQACAALGLDAATTPVGTKDCVVPAGRQYLVFENISDLPAGADQSTSLTLRPKADSFPVGSDELDIKLAVYASDAERLLPLFPGSSSKAANADHTSAPGIADTNIPVLAFRIEKSEPSPESELLRGVHDNTTVYTLRVHHTAEGTVGNTEVLDFLPAGLEYLGAGRVDNTEDANGTQGSIEYPNAPRLDASTPDLSGEHFDDSESAVETIVATAEQAALYGLVEGQVYTKVTWKIGAVAPTSGFDKTSGVKQVFAETQGRAGYFEIRYRAGIPLFENTMDFGGEAPSAGSLGQMANLDNNRGASTRHVRTDANPTAVKALTNVAAASGEYAGKATVSVDDHTVDAVDVRVLKGIIGADGKPAPSGSFFQGELATYQVTIKTSEYVSAEGRSAQLHRHRSDRPRTAGRDRQPGGGDPGGDPGAGRRRREQHRRGTLDGARER